MMPLTIMDLLNTCVERNRRRTKTHGESPNLAGMSVPELEAFIARAETAKADAEAREAKRMEMLAEFKRLAGEAGAQGCESRISASASARSPNRWGCRKLKTGDPSP